MKITLLFIPVVLLITCTGTKSLINQDAYHYDNRTGKCLNSKGEVGYNTLDISSIHKNKDCVCIDFDGIDIVDLLPNIDEGNRFSYNLLDSFDFRGASLDGASLHFNNIKNARFEGAKMKNFEFGYANIQGTIDEFTEAPVEGCFGDSDTKIDCSR